MEKFNKYKHTSLITKWWLEDSKLSALLKIDRGYKLPSDWIKDLEDSNAFIFSNGLGEIRDFLIGERSKESEIFYYSPNINHQTEIAGQLIRFCLQRGITKIRVKQLEVKEQIITREQIVNLVSVLKGENNGSQSKLHDKSTSISTATSISDTTNATYTEELPNNSASTKAGSPTTSTVSPATGTITEELPNGANSNGKKPTDNNIHPKKQHTKGKKKQPARKQEKEPATV